MYTIPLLAVTFAEVISKHLWREWPLLRVSVNAESESSLIQEEHVAVTYIAVPP